MRAARNTSGWMTVDVMRIVRQATGRLLWPQHRARVRVTIVRASRHTTGRASIGGYEMLLRIPPGASAEEVAAVARHEALHLAGYRHPDFTPQDMRCATVREDGSARFGWARALPWRRKNSAGPARNSLATFAPMAEAAHAPGALPGATLNEGGTE